MNAEYIRRMDEATFTAHAAPYYDEVLPTNDSQKQVLCQILQQRLETFAEIPDKIAFLRALTGGIPTVHYGYLTSGVEATNMLLDTLDGVEGEGGLRTLKLGHQLMNV